MIQVDPEDQDLLIKYSWHISEKRYVQAWLPDKQKQKYLHQLIAERMGIVGEADHIDRDNQNCRRNNLRSATQTQNEWNKGLKITNTSGYIGVSWSIKYQKWQAQISYEKRKKHLGYYDTAIEAAKAYDRACKRFRGDRAVLNFPGE